MPFFWINWWIDRVLGTPYENGGEYMGWQLDKDRPIYIQLVEELQSRIVSGL